MHTAQQSLSISYDLFIVSEVGFECGREEIKQISIKWKYFQAITFESILMVFVGIFLSASFALFVSIFCSFSFVCKYLKRW